MYSSRLYLATLYFEYYQYLSAQSSFSKYMKSMRKTAAISVALIWNESVCRIYILLSIALILPSHPNPRENSPRSCQHRWMPPSWLQSIAWKFCQPRKKWSSINTDITISTSWGLSSMVRMGKSTSWQQLESQIQHVLFFSIRTVSPPSFLIANLSLTFCR